MDWTGCKKNRLIKEVALDKNMIISLIMTSSRRLSSQALLKLNDETADSKISLVYDALREILEAISLSRGYKIYNHECYYYFLREILRESALADKFNSFRVLRNAINYYGKTISANEAGEIINEMIKLIDRLKKLLND